MHSYSRGFSIDKESWKLNYFDLLMKKIAKELWGKKGKLERDTRLAI